MESINVAGYRISSRRRHRVIEVAAFQSDQLTPDIVLTMQGPSGACRWELDVAMPPAMDGGPTLGKLVQVMCQMHIRAAEMQRDAG